MEAGCRRIILWRAVEDRERRCCTGRSRAICSQVDADRLPSERKRMDSLSVSIGDGIAEVTMRRGKVNALSEPSVKELSAAFRDLAQTPGVRSVILTGQGPFFSFGFDIPEFLSYSKESFTRFLAS